MTPTPITDRPNALDNTLVHRLLVLSERIAGLSDAYLIGSLVIDAFTVGVVWASLYGLMAGAAAALAIGTFAGVCAVFLYQLPRAGRSWGSPKPPLIALTAVAAVLVSVIGVFGLPFVIVPIMLILIAGIACYATWIEPFRVGVTRQRLKTADGRATFTLLHMGDLHLEHISPREHKLNALIKQLAPDVIVFSGDFVNISYTYDRTTESEIRTVIGAWQSPLGVWCVPGTPAVEPLDRVIAFTTALPGVTLLTNTWHTIQTNAGVLHILGLITTHDLKLDREALRIALEDAPTSEGVRLMLTHSPDLAPEAAQAGFDLYVCGHTHGGQLRLPLLGALFTASHYGRQFSMGRYRIGHMTLYVTRGLGMEGFGAPRARFLCPPELVFWEITF